jgi:hypothetical protein
MRRVRRGHGDARVSARLDNLRVRFPRFFQTCHIARYRVILNAIGARCEEILDATSHAIHKLIPPAYILPLITMFIKVLKSTDMAIIHSPERDSGHNVVVVDVPERLGRKVDIKIFGKLAIPCAWLPKRIHPMDGFILFEAEFCHRQCC